MDKRFIEFLKKCRTRWYTLAGQLWLWRNRYQKEEAVCGRNIIIFGRLRIRNFGDPIIADCCRYLIDKAAHENGIAVKTQLADIHEANHGVIQRKLEGKDAVVFAGGGMNSRRYNRTVLAVLDMVEKQEDTAVYFNAIGILKTEKRKKNIALLKEIFNRPQIKQITTRGDLKKLEAYIQRELPYPVSLVLDPAMWVNEAYGVEKKPDADVVGVGVIRPEIYGKNAVSLAETDVFAMYSAIILELEKRGYKWQLFTNGLKDDYRFGLKLLKHIGRPKTAYIGANTGSAKELVEKISGYQAVIAARLHANIIATSLGVPSVGLVWNDKMNQFGNVIGCGNRYIGEENLTDSGYIVDRMEEALANGYDMARIEKMKKLTLDTIKNILE